MARIRFGRLAGSLSLVAVVAVGVSGCMLVPVPAPVAAPVIVAPRPRPVFVPGRYTATIRTTGEVAAGLADVTIAEAQERARANLSS